MNSAINARRRVVVGGWCSAVLLLAAGGCSTTPKVAPVHTFFPPPPDEPRIQFLTSFGAEGDLGGQSWFARFVLGTEQTYYRPIVKPYGITATPGKIYVCDTQASAVAIVDLAKRRLRHLRPTGDGALIQPINVAVDKDGTRYVTDTKRNQVLIYDKHDNYLGAIGKEDEMRPCGLAVNGDRLYVTDLRHGGVRVYGKTTHELLFTVPRDTTNANARLYGPTNIAIDQQGRLYVSDTRGFVAHVYDADGNFLRGIGDHGLDLGSFALPKGIGVDHDGRVYVVDAATAVVQMFDPEGRLLMFFGVPKTSGPGSLYLPAGLAIDYENVDYFKKYVAPGYRVEFLILVVNQVGAQKVNVYGFLKKS